VLKGQFNYYKMFINPAIKQCFIFNILHVKSIVSLGLDLSHFRLSHSFLSVRRKVFFSEGALPHRSRRQRARNFLSSSPACFRAEMAAVAPPLSPLQSVTPSGCLPACSPAWLSLRGRHSRRHRHHDYDDDNDDSPLLDSALLIGRNCGPTRIK